MLLDTLLAELDVHVEPFAICVVSRGWRLRLPGPPEVMLHYVLEGEGVLRDAECREHRLSASSLAVVPRGSGHSLRWPGAIDNELRVDEPPAQGTVPRVIAGPCAGPLLRVACGLVRVRFGDALGLFDHLHEVLAVDLSDSPLVRTAIKGILAEQAHPGPGASAMMEALMSQCLVILLRRLTEGTAAPAAWLAALQDPRLAKALERILEDPAANHTVESLAVVAGMSRSAFAERFRAAFEHSPKALLHQVRMGRAAHLLRQGMALSIDEVADRVGFSSRSHFSRAFKRHTGTSPAEYRGQT